MHEKKRDGDVREQGQGSGGAAAASAAAPDAVQDAGVRFHPALRSRVKRLKGENERK